jgi:glycosyltransferase involved in cell wall biosynthesis
VVNDLLSHGYRVLVVDDGSIDETAVRARAAGATVLQLPMNLGVGGALRAGFRFAVESGFTSVVQCDADGQHIASEISMLLSAAGGNSADMVIGTRFDAESPEFSVRHYRRVAMRLLARLASRATDTDISDATSGFRLIRQPLLSAFARQFPSHYLGDTFEALVAAGKAGYRVAEVPVQMRDRQYGESSASFAVALRLTLRALILASGGTSFRLASQRR